MEKCFEVYLTLHFKKILLIFIFNSFLSLSPFFPSLPPSSSHPHALKEWKPFDHSPLLESSLLGFGVSYFMVLPSSFVTHF